MYSSFNCIYFDHAHVKPRILTRNGIFTYGQVLSDIEPLHTCSVWGPTCDSMDVISKDCQLPELQIGDWFYFPDMGAYTIAAATTFNGFRKCNVLWTNTEYKYIQI
ncbi:hypothetical protein HMI54_005265 [Coelomomyces lativittatus]|nr:hypothetical protein HMI56_006031 [Coelomomyces lativittatus]KAJ1506201.1 hypothetical protein HMI54_005265 [Coelomomyces lativittatus]